MLRYSGMADMLSAPDEKCRHEFRIMPLRKRDQDAEKFSRAR